MTFRHWEDILLGPHFFCCCFTSLIKQMRYNAFISELGMWILLLMDRASLVYGKELVDALC